MAAGNTTTPTLLTPEIQRALGGVRRRIRWYVWVEGLSLAVIWVGSMFWLALALDYLPVLVGASEMPAVARGVVLAVVAAVLAFILYRWIWRRMVVPLRDHSMALLLERKNEDLQDSLVTTVELSEFPAHAAEFDPEMLAHTTDVARQGIRGIRPGRIFNYGPLALRVALALGLIGSIGGFAAVEGKTVTQAARRLYLLSDDPWERNAQIEVVGIEVQQAAAPGESTSRTVELPFENGVVKVAKGVNVALKVRALLPPAAKVAPNKCTIYYRADRTSDGSGGERGSVLMTSSRDAGGYRHFRFDGKPLRGMLTSLSFDVVGYDHRVRDLRLEVVDSPAIIATHLDLNYPDYMVDEATSNYLPVKDQEYLPAGTFIPLGTNVTLKFTSNKPLKQAEIYNVDSKEVRVVTIPADQANKRHFMLPLGALAGNVTLEVSLLDADNVTTERPHKVYLTGVEDRPPLVDVRLRGIGTAVTPDVLIPFAGKIGDDYAVAKSWFDVQIGETEPRKIDLTLGRGGLVNQPIDFREQRSQGTGLEIKPADKLFLTVQAEDKYDLSGGPQIGSGERYQLDVVTADELLAQLEVREIGLRRRFEQTLDELNQMRDSLVRAKASLIAGGAADEPGEVDPDEPKLTAEEKAERDAQLRLLRVQRALQQSQKSAQETLGVADGFAVIREELINNRVDTEERKLRLQQQIADPLRAIVAAEFPRLDQHLASFEEKLRLAPPLPADPAPLASAGDDVLAQADETIGQLEAILKLMLDLESYNELMDLVRDLIRDQEVLRDRTSQERKRQALEDLQ
ncbi:MAG TPA: hypothetical protein VMP01_22295 [Pirellulaceae bacterium]|nr:hypothetical protein [Pirellulaceae bacterium]